MLVSSQMFFVNSRYILLLWPHSIVNDYGSSHRDEMNAWALAIVGTILPTQQFPPLNAAYTYIVWDQQHCRLCQRCALQAA